MACSAWSLIMSTKDAATSELRVVKDSNEKENVVEVGSAASDTISEQKEESQYLTTEKQSEMPEKQDDVENEKQKFDDVVSKEEQTAFLEKSDLNIPKEEVEVVPEKGESLEKMPEVEEQETSEPIVTEIAEGEKGDITASLVILENSGSNVEVVPEKVESLGEMPEIPEQLEKTGLSGEMDTNFENEQKRNEIEQIDDSPDGNIMQEAAKSEYPSTGKQSDTKNVNKIEGEKLDQNIRDVVIVISKEDQLACRDYLEKLELKSRKRKSTDGKAKAATPEKMIKSESGETESGQVLPVVERALCKLCKARGKNVTAHLYEMHLCKVTVQCPFCTFGVYYNPQTIQSHMQSTHPHQDQHTAVIDHRESFKKDIRKLYAQCFDD